MAGLIDAIVANVDEKPKKKQMIVNLLEPESITAEEIQAIREKLGMDESTFADNIGVSAETVKAWEAGEKKPGASAIQIMGIMAKEADAQIES